MASVTRDSTLEVVLDEVGRDADEADAVSFEVLLSLSVSFFPTIVNAPVDFNSQAFLVAVEVEHKSSRWMLAAELHSIEVAIPQRLPEDLL